MVEPSPRPILLQSKQKRNMAKKKKITFVVTSVWDEPAEFATQKEAIAFVKDIVEQGEFPHDITVYKVDGKYAVEQGELQLKQLN